MSSFLNPEPVSCSICGSNICFLICLQVSEDPGKSGPVFPPVEEFSTICYDPHNQRLYRVFSEKEVEVSLELICYFCDPANGDNLSSGSSDVSKPTLNTWNFSVHVKLKPSMKNFKHNFISIGDKHNCVVISTFFSPTLLGKWGKD